MATPYHIDLHTHTCYSDGVDTPTALVTKAAAGGVSVLAITDHDTVEALPEAQEAGGACGVEVIVGIELTVQYQQYDDIHMLGYAFDPTHAALCARLALVQHHRVQRGLEMLTRINARLAALGKAPLDSQQVVAQAQGALTRPHLAQALVARGYVESIQGAFRDFLIPCNVPKAALSPTEAFALIAQAGGVCSLAHPGTLSTDPQEIHPLLAALTDMGLVGLEVYHHAHYPATLEFFQACATRYGLCMTGGSDYHGRPTGALPGYFAPTHPVPVQALADLRHAHARRL